MSQGGIGLPQGTNDLMSTTLARARYAARVWLSGAPRLYPPFARWKYGKIPDRLVKADTELVIEGFQRSGNTFAVFAFEMAQDRPVTTAHHLHSSAQVVMAVELGVPALVLIRDPKDSTLSHLIREPRVPMRQALSAWTRFYERIAPYRDRVLVADFSRVSTDFGLVIRDLNEKFGTGYKEFDHTAENVERCFQMIEERNRERYGALVEGKVARPSDERRSRKEALAAAFDAPALAARRDRAYRVYRTLVPATGS
jgi:hypothetical protein